MDCFHNSLNCTVCYNFPRCSITQYRCTKINTTAHATQTIFDYFTNKCKNNDTEFVCMKCLLKWFVKCLFSGYDLVEWLMDRFNLDETSNGEFRTLLQTLCIET